MVHVQSINYTSPTYHKTYVKAVSRWKYPVVCKIRKGWFRPYHAQVFIDDFRVPEIVHDQFIADVGYINPTDFVKRTEFKSWVVKTIIKILRFFGPWNTKPPERKVPLRNVPGWRYNLLLGVVKDPIQLTKHDKKYKEVL